MKKKILISVFTGLSMLMLILDSKTALAGGVAGLRACVATVIPSLLPFFVLSILLTDALTGASLKPLHPLGRLCKMPPGTESLLLIGLLGGYPAGAQAISQTYQSGQLSRQDARRLLGFCNNAGPSFLFGIAAVAFPYSWMPWALWLIHITGAMLTGILLPGGTSQRVILPPDRAVTLPQALERSIRILAGVCGWIILFRIVLAFCDRWFLWLFPTELRVFFCGAVELANGCLELSSIKSVPLRFCVCSAVLSLGGVSVTMQTLSVTGDLSFGLYLPGKLLQCFITVTLSMLVFCPQYIPAALFAVFFACFIMNIKNSSRKTKKLIV